MTTSKCPLVCVSLNLSRITRQAILQRVQVGRPSSGAVESDRRIGRVSGDPTAGVRLEVADARDGKAGLATAGQEVLPP